MTRQIVRALLLVIGAAAPGCAPNAPPPSRGEESGSEYVFVPNTDRRVGIIRGNLRLCGHLDTAGNFRELFRLKHGQPTSGGAWSETINWAGGSRPVYEYRSGLLIKGEIHEDGNFVPEVGSTVIRLEDYRYSPDAIRIWNLPGWFVKKSELKEVIDRMKKP